MEPILNFYQWIKETAETTSNLISVAIIFNSFEQRTKDKFGDIQLGYFEYLIENGPKYGLDVFICKREDLYGDEEEVTAYLNKKTDWIKVTKPYPKAVYQREGSYKYDIYDHLIKRGVKLYQEVPMLKTVTNKIKTAKLIQDSGVLTPTTYLYSPEKVMEYINKGESCFIKPIYGQLGDGTIRINPDYTLQISDKTYKHSQNTIIKAIEYLIIEKWKWKTSSFLVQDLVDMPKYKDSVFDARVMVQKDENGIIQYSAHMARIGASNKITSNIHTGGSFEKLEKVLFECYRDESIVKRLISDVYKGTMDISARLDREYGKFGEIGFDWLFTNDNKAICIELNPRPGKFIFSKEPKIEKMLRDRVLEYISFLTK